MSRGFRHPHHACGQGRSNRGTAAQCSMLPMTAPCQLMQVAVVAFRPFTQVSRRASLGRFSPDLNSQGLPPAKAWTSAGKSRDGSFRFARADVVVRDIEGRSDVTAGHDICTLDGIRPSDPDRRWTPMRKISYILATAFAATALLLGGAATALALGGVPAHASHVTHVLAGPVLCCDALSA